MGKELYKLGQDEQEIIEGFANKIGFFGGGGGKLVLTNQRLLFTNRRKTQIKMDIPLTAVLHTGKASSASIWSVFLLFTLFLKNAIRVTLRDGNTQRFVVNNNGRWVDLINEYRKA